MSQIQFEIFNKASFEEQTDQVLNLFRIQYEKLPVYNQYCQLLGIKTDKVNSLTDIPFLPIEFFKSHRILLEDENERLEFRSSGTGKTGVLSRHLVSQPELYHQSLINGFVKFVGHPGEMNFASLLPGYSEHSSLIYMIDQLSEQSQGELKVISNHEDLTEFNQMLNPVLFGVSHALIRLAEKESLNLDKTTIIETGGMKGLEKEITKEELHKIIQKNLKPKRLISEYGMTELLSQAYADSGSSYVCPPWMKGFVRDVNDPLNVNSLGSGALNIIDLANQHSCAFVATADLTTIHTDGSFDILGRMDFSDIRGCNLLTL